MRDPDQIGSELAGYFIPRYPAGSLISARCDLIWKSWIQIRIDHGSARYLVAWYPVGYRVSSTMVNAYSREYEFFIYWVHKKENCLSIYTLWFQYELLQLGVRALKDHSVDSNVRKK